MPRVHHVKKAMKDNPAVKKGEPYYWWAFRFGGKCYSNTYPRSSQLTQSEYLSTLYGLQEQLSDLVNDSLDNLEQLQKVYDEVENITSEMENLQSETEDKQCSLEDAFPNGCPTLDLLTSRVEACESNQQELENIQQEIEGYLSEIKESKIRIGGKKPDQVLLTESEKNTVIGLLEGMCWEEGD